METNRYKLYQSYISNKDHKLVLTYKGPFLEEILSKLGDIVRDTFTSDVVMSRKLLSVFIELAQNVYYYSAETVKMGDKEYGIGSVCVSKEDDHYEFTTGNFVPVHYVEDLRKSCDLVNSLNRDELRKLKRETRSVDVESEKSRGAGIGLIQIALTAGEHIEYEVIPHDDKNVFFCIITKIKN